MTASFLAAPSAAIAPSPAVTYATGPLNGQNGWDGGIVSGNPVPFTNDNPGSNVVQDTVAYDGSQSWLLGGSYNSPGAGTPFTPVVATVGAPNATDFGSPVTPAGDQSVVSLAFKANAAGDASRFSVYEGSHARDDRTGAHLSVRNDTVNGNPVGTVSLYASGLDTAACTFPVLNIGSVSNDEWHTVTMTTTYPEIVDGDYSTMGSTVYVIDEGTEDEVTSAPVVSWMHPYREAPACNVNSAYTPGSSLKFTTFHNDYPAHQGFSIDNLSMTVRDTVSDTTVARFATGFEATLNAPGAPTALTATEDASTVDLAWTAPSDEGDSPITGYSVYRNDVLIGTTAAVTTSYQDTTATASSVAYTYKVTAQNAIGSSPASNTDTAVVDLTWKGQVWDVLNGTAVINGDGGVDLTRLATGQSWLHMVGAAPINANGTPWVQFDYTDDGTSYQGIDLFIDSLENPGDDPRVQAGSLFACDTLGYARHSIPEVEEMVYPDDDSLCQGPRNDAAHSLYIGQLADGTVDYNADGTWHTTSFLKDATGPFEFNDIILRWRCRTNSLPGWAVGCTGGETITFDDFAMGANHLGVPDPSITLQLAVDETSVTVGDDINYHLTATNTGNAPLTGLKILDHNAPDCAGPIANLAVGASAAVDCTYTTTNADVGSRSNAAAIMSAEYAFALSNIVTTTVLADVDPFGHITGTVTDAASDDPLPGTWLVALSTSDFAIGGGAVSDANGDFVLDVVPGSYFVYLIEPTDRHTNGFANLVPVTVDAGETVDVDQAIDPKRGAISGVVTDASTDDPIPDAWAVALTAGGQPEIFVSGDGDGEYTLGDLKVGQHYVGWVDPSGAHQSRFAPNSPNVPDATTVPVAAGNVTTSNGSLPPQVANPGGETLSGTITAASTGDPIENVRVVALHAANFGIARGTVTDASGNYELDVAGGSYKLAFVDSNNRHTMEWYNDQPNTGLGDATTVIAPAVTDESLTETTGAVSGTVVDADSGDPLEGVWVLAIGPSGAQTGTLTGPDGTYTITGLAPGSYHQVFVDPSGERAIEYFDGHGQFDGSDTFGVTAGATTAIDADLGSEPGI